MILPPERDPAGPPQAERSRDDPNGSVFGSTENEEVEGAATPSPFPHPPWTVNLVLVAGVITLLFGLLVDPVWLLVGSPFVLVLALWLYIRLFVGPKG